MPKQVLIVDDEETLTFSLAKSLSRDRDTYELTTANDGLTALEILNRSPFDLVVLDLRLPGINGLDLLIKIKQDMPSTKVIIMTAYGNQETKEKAKARGSLYYIEKPFELEHLRSLILKSLNEEADKGFDGSIHGLKLPDLIQMNCLGQVTTALYVKKDTREGVIFFDEGQIIHAKVGAVEGEDAFFSILSWQSGIFRFVGNERPPQRTITNNWEYLLIEGMRKADEMALALEKGEHIEEDMTTVDEPSRLLIRNLTRLPELSGIALLTHSSDIIYCKGIESSELEDQFFPHFFINLPEYLSGIIDSPPKRVSFTNHKSVKLLYPFRIYIVILKFNRQFLLPDTLNSIEKILLMHEV